MQRWSEQAQERTTKEQLFQNRDEQEYGCEIEGERPQAFPPWIELNKTRSEGQRQGYAGEQHHVGRDCTKNKHIQPRFVSDIRNWSKDDPRPTCNSNDQQTRHEV